MQSQAFAITVVERGAATLALLEGALEHQLLFGGDLGTNLLAAGALTEPALQRLLADYHQLPLGPPGALSAPSKEALGSLPLEEVLQYRVYPLKLTAGALQVALSWPLDATAREHLRAAVGVPLRPSVVTQLRLDEALSRHYGAALSERDKRLLVKLEAGEIEPQLSLFSQEQAPVSWVPPAPAYRRISERARGVVASLRQPAGAPDVLSPTVGDDADAPAPDSSRGFGTEAFLSESPSQPPPAQGDRDTQPYGDDEQTGDGHKRNTRPWAEDPEEDDWPGSLRGEFQASLTGPPTGGGAASRTVHTERRAFRHRGPFTRAQAEQCVGEAREVQVVLEILLRYARQFFERCVLFVVRGQEAQLRISNGVPRELADLRIDLSVDSIFAEACAGGDPVVRALDGSAAAGGSALDIHLAAQLGASSGRVLVVPLHVRERVVALFYGDDGAADIDAGAADDVIEFSEICAGEVTRVIVANKRRQALASNHDDADAY